MRLTAADYREAAEEHVETARRLHEAARYPAAHYMAGLAVECLFRAYRHRMDPEFDARHDLRQLFIVSGFPEVVHSLRDAERIAITKALDVPFKRWRNNQRFGSERTLRRFLKQEKLDRGIRGNILKENSRLMVVAAAFVVEVGMRKWLH